MRADGTVETREGEAIDPAALGAWLAEAVPGLAAPDAPITIRQYAAGFSNLTYLVAVQGGEGEVALVLRRPPRGVGGGVAHDMVREFGILTALERLGVPVPRPIALCRDASVIGAPFYVMERVDGVILRGPLPPELPSDEHERRARLAALSRVFVGTLAGLHAVPVDTPPLSAFGKPDGYVARQVQGWTRRWEAARVDSVPDLDHVARWLDERQPPSGAPALVHNDFKFDNLVLDPALDRVRAVLDWEMSTLGDPLLDLGTSLAYWVEAGDAPVFRSLGLGVTALPGNLTRAGLVAEYARASRRDTSDVAYHYAFGLFKVAVIAAQIHARHLQGLTSDPRFARLGEVVRALGGAARDAAVTGRL